MTAMGIKMNVHQGVDMSQTVPADQSRTQGPPAAPVTRQFVNFSFYKLDPAFRRLPKEDKNIARAEFAAIFAQHKPGFLCLTYSLAGLRPDTDFLLWRISA